MAAVTAAISSTVSLGLFGEKGIFGSFSGTQTEQYLKQLTASTAVGALMGGISAEIFGGSFGEGAMWGAASAAASYMLSSTLYEDSQQSDNPSQTLAMDIDLAELTMSDMKILGSAFEPKVGDTYEEVIEIATLPHRLNPWSKEYNEWIQKHYKGTPSIPLSPEWFQGKLQTNPMVKNYSRGIIKAFAKDKSWWRAWVKVQKYQYKNERYGWFWLKKRIVAKVVGKPQWREVTGTNSWSKKGWEKGLGYRNQQSAYEAAYRESYMKYKYTLAILPCIT